MLFKIHLPICSPTFTPTHLSPYTWLPQKILKHNDKVHDRLYEVFEKERKEHPEKWDTIDYDSSKPVSANSTNVCLDPRETGGLRHYVINR